MQRNPQSVISEVKGRGFSKKEGVLRHVKCYKEFREDKKINLHWIQKSRAY